jgi:hypothetical protein
MYDLQKNPNVIINTEILIIRKKNIKQVSQANMKKKTGNATLRNLGNNLGGY